MSSSESDLRPQLLGATPPASCRRLAEVCSLRLRTDRLPRKIESGVAFYSQPVSRLQASIALNFEDWTLHSRDREASYHLSRESIDPSLLAEACQFRLWPSEPGHQTYAFLSFFWQGGELRHSPALSQNLEIPRSCRISLMCQTSADLGAEKPSKLPGASSRAAPASQRTSARTSCKAPHRRQLEENTVCKRRVPGIDRTRMQLLSEGSWSCGKICPSNPNLLQSLNQGRTQQMVPTLCCRTSARGRHKPLTGHGLRLGSILDGRRFQILRPEAGAGLPWPGASVDSELASGPYLGVRMEYNKQGPAIVASLELN